MKNITKLTLGRDCRVIYEDISLNDDPITCSMKAFEEPHSDLYDALDPFLKEAKLITHVDADAWAAAKVQSITFKHESDGIGVVVTISCTFDDQAVSISTPYLSYSDLAFNQVMQLHQEIVKFVDGKRRYEQQSLLTELPQLNLKAKAKELVNA